MNVKSYVAGLLNTDEVLVNVVQDGNGTIRLCVDPGVPKLGQVTSFKSIHSGPVANGTALYTAPQGKTFYIFGIVMENTNNATNTGNGLNISFGTTQTGTTLNPTINGASSLVIINNYPSAIVQENDSVVANSLPANTAVTFWGYEEFGVTK